MTATIIQAASPTTTQPAAVIGLWCGTGLGRDVVAGPGSVRRLDDFGCEIQRFEEGLNMVFRWAVRIEVHDPLVARDG